MKTTIYAILCIIVGALSTGLSEVMLITWLGVAPFEVTGNIVIAGIFPVIFVVVGITTLLLMKPYAHNPKLNMGLYVVAFSVSHGVELTQFGNPPMDVLSYMLAIWLAAAVWFTLLYRTYIAKRVSNTP